MMRERAMKGYALDPAVNMEICRWVLRVSSHETALSPRTPLL